MSYVHIQHRLSLTEPGSVHLRVLPAPGIARVRVQVRRPHAILGSGQVLHTAWLTPAPGDPQLAYPAALDTSFALPDGPCVAVATPCVVMDRGVGFEELEVELNGQGALDGQPTEDHRAYCWIGI